MKSTYGQINSSILDESYTEQKKMFKNLKDRMQNYKLRLSVTDDFGSSANIQKNMIAADEEPNKQEDLNTKLTNRINEQKSGLDIVGNAIANTMRKNDQTVIYDDTLCLMAANKMMKYEQKDTSIEKHQSAVIYENINDKLQNKITNFENTIDLCQDSFNIPGLTLISNDTTLFDELYKNDHNTSLHTMKVIDTKETKSMERMKNDCNETRFHLSTCNYIDTIQLKQDYNKESIFDLSVSNIDKSLYYDYESDISFDYVPKKKVKQIELESVPNSSFYEKYLKLETKAFKELKCKNIKKINEATFSDVYLLNGMIYKIINFTEMTEGEFYKESFINKALASEKGIIKYIDCFFVEGCYPRHFLKAWNEFENKCNRRPKSGIHKYGVLIMEFGGIDLESFVFSDEHEVEYFLHELVFILENLEDKFEFEHRDLHWGNILIKRNEYGSADKRLMNYKEIDSKAKRKRLKKQQDHHICNPNKKGCTKKCDNNSLESNLPGNKKTAYDKTQPSKKEKQKYKDIKLHKKKKKSKVPKLPYLCKYPEYLHEHAESSSDSESDKFEDDNKSYKLARINTKNNKNGATDETSMSSEDQDIFRNKRFVCKQDQKLDEKYSKIDKKSMKKQLKEAKLKKGKSKSAKSSHKRSHAKTGGFYAPFEINIIDFTLSRMKYKNKIIYTDLSSKDWIFEGNEAEDLQYGIYKKMKRDEYVSFDDNSNYLWFDYVFKKVMTKYPDCEIYNVLQKQINSCNCIKDLAEEIRCYKD